MLTTLAWIFLILSILIMLILALRRFPALAILNVDNMPGQKEAKFKEKIMKQRLERDLSAWSGRLNRLRRQVGGFISSFLKKRHQRLMKVKNDLRKYRKLTWREKQDQIDLLFLKANKALEAEDYEQAEARLIEIISLDPKRVKAFLELAESYRLRKSLKEAKETLEHALKLALKLRRDPELLGSISISEIQFSLAWVCQEAELWSDALEYGRQALDAEPNNPRYLDLILDLSIIKKDKKLALETWGKLALANPDNNKLGTLKEKIDLLPEEIDNKPF